MEKTTLFLCIYCAIIGTCLWLALFLTLKTIIFRMENRYNLSVPFIVVDKVGRNSRVRSRPRIQANSNDESAIISDQDNNTDKAQNYERF